MGQNINMFHDFTFKVLLRKDEDKEKIDAYLNNLDSHWFQLIVYNL